MKSVVITGASTGIGRACAINLVERGMQVFAGVRKTEDGDRLRLDTSDALVPIRLDVVDAGSITQATNTVRAAVGDAGLHGLVNNAGISVTGPLEFLPLADLRRQFEVNLFGQVAVTQALLPLLRMARGRIVNMSSIGGRSAAPILGAYSMSKFALEAFSDALRRELAPWGLEVSCIEPGAIATPIWTKGLESADEAVATATPEARALYGPAMTAMRRFAENAGRTAAPAHLVARSVHHALTAAKPKTRYVVGRDAKIQATLVRWLPDRLLDGMYRRVLASNV